jgi:hypothetical protein
VNALTQRVEEWYRKNDERLAERFPKAQFTEKNWDTERGGVIIEIEGPTLIATITFWFKGDVAVEVIKKDADQPFYLDDRVLRPDENIGLLLDGYLRAIENLA